jgi:hypothetical protein
MFPQTNGSITSMTLLEPDNNTLKLIPIVGNSYDNALSFILHGCHYAHKHYIVTSYITRTDINKPPVHELCYHTMIHDKPITWPSNNTACYSNMNNLLFFWRQNIRKLYSLVSSDSHRYVTTSIASKCTQSTLLRNPKEFSSRKYNKHRIVWNLNIKLLSEQWNMLPCVSQWNPCMFCPQQSNTKLNCDQTVHLFSWWCGLFVWWSTQHATIAMYFPLCLPWHIYQLEHFCLLEINRYP